MQTSYYSFFQILFMVLSVGLGVTRKFIFNIKETCILFFGCSITSIGSYWSCNLHSLYSLNCLKCLKLFAIVTDVLCIPINLLSTLSLVLSLIRNGPAVLYSGFCITQTVIVFAWGVLFCKESAFYFVRCILYFKKDSCYFNRYILHHKIYMCYIFRLVFWQKSCLWFHKRYVCFIIRFISYCEISAWYFVSSVLYYNKCTCCIV